VRTEQDRPNVVEGLATIGPIKYVALTCERRLVDGREDVLFLRRVEEVVENLARMLVEI